MVTLFLTQKKKTLTYHKFIVQSAKCVFRHPLPPGTRKIFDCCLKKTKFKTAITSFISSLCYWNKNYFEIYTLFFTYKLTLFSVFLPEAAIQRDKRWSKFETTLLKVSAGIALNAAIFFALRSSVLVGLARNTTYFTWLHKKVKRKEIRRFRRPEQFTSAGDDLVLESWLQPFHGH